VRPNRLVSDGTTLFWTTAQTPGFQAMPVGGGEVTVLIAGTLRSDTIVTGVLPFLAVDDATVYVLQDYGIFRIPKSGAPPSLVNEAVAVVFAATVLGPRLLDGEHARDDFGSQHQRVAVKSAPLAACGAVSLVAVFDLHGLPDDSIGVTSGSVIVSQPLHAFPITGAASLSAPEPGSSVRGGSNCLVLTSDADAVYCNNQEIGDNLRVAGDGTTSSRCPAVSSSYIVFDDTYAYWPDMTTVGTIMKAPKNGGSGGGTATLLARDTSPTAIAVDAVSVYWSDEAGYIKSVPK